MPKLATQLLTPIVHQFLASWVTSMRSNAGDPPTSELKHMATHDPVSGLCIQLVNLYVLASLGEYTHHKKRIEAQVRKSISSSKGSWKATLESLLSFIPFGRSFAEFAYHPPGTISMDNKAYLKEIRILDPERYRFDGSRGEITDVVYSGLEEIKIPYDQGVHLVNEPHLAFGNPLGISSLVRAYPYWRLHQILMPILSVASQRQATPILIYKTETEATIEILDQYGQPVSTITKGEDAKRSIEALSSSGALVVDREDEVVSVEQEVACDLLMGIMKLCEQYRMMSCLVPSTIASFSSSGIGDAGLAESQRSVFEAISSSRSSYVGEGVVEGIIKPMIIFNYGEQDDYGHFPVSTKDPTALAIAELITQAVQRGAITAEDKAAMNRLRELLGIAAIA